MKIILIAPAHNEEKILKIRMEEAIEASKTRPIGRIIIAENGSSDRTKEIATSLAVDNGVVPIDVILSNIVDYGLALRQAMIHILQTNQFDDDYFLLSAADLPFEMSDIDSFLREHQSRNQIYLGSKSHPDSRVDRPFSRRFLSLVFFLIRFIFLRLTIQDTQGTVFIPVSVARTILPEVKSNGFFFSTELIYRLKKKNFFIKELPVNLRKEDRPSKVKWLKVSLQMLKKTLELARE